jgi:outer membrane protein assembly factor BamB
MKFKYINMQTKSLPVNSASRRGCLPFLFRFFLLLMVMNISDPAGASGWPNFRGDSRLTGITGQSIPASPRLLWSFETGSEIKSTPVIHDSRIIFGAGNGTVYCLNMQGGVLWQFDTGNTIEAPALVHDNRVYIGNLEGILFCLDPGNGNVIWRYECDNQIMASPNVWSSGSQDLILVGSYDYYLHAIDALSGKPVWKYELYNYLNSAVAIGNDMAIFGGCDGYLHRVDLKSGRGLEQIELASYVAGSPALDNGIAYTGDYDGVFSAVDYLNGNIIWQWSDKERDLPFVASPSVFGNSVIIGNRDRFVYSLEKRTGRMQWKTNTGSRVDASTITDGQRVLAANMRGDIMLMDFKTGRIGWTYEAGSPISGSPAVSGGRIVIGTNGGSLFCFGN